MARIVELTYPDNVTLLPGAMQNWRDLAASDGPHGGALTGPGAASPLLHGMVDRLLTALPEAPRRCLVAGPHDPALLARVAAAVGELTVLVRAIPDATTIGTALPDATVLCGSLAAARSHGGTPREGASAHGPYDLVLALDDVTRLHSLEEEPRTWRALAADLAACVAEGGTLALGIENDLGLHRVSAPIADVSRDDDGNWSPLMTWDATRPRTPRQVADFAATVRIAPAAAVHQVFPDWRTPHTAATRLDEAPRALRDLLAALVGRPVGDRPPAPGLLERRAVTMADRWPDVCAGWVLVWSPGVEAEEPPPCCRRAPTVVRSAGCPGPTDASRGPPGCPARGGSPPPIAVPALGRTLMFDLAEATTDSDTPRIRHLLAGWRAWLEGRAVGGVLPAPYADARFATLMVGADEDCVPIPLEPATAPAPLQEAIWTALADLLATWRAAGLRTPWPSSMHPHTVFRALTAMAGVPAPADVDRYWPDPARGTATARPMTRQEMMAVITRQREQLRGAWSRFHWDERQYLTYRLEKFGGRVGRRLRREARGLIRRNEAQ
ncbi:hypothetical protein [Raineyella fluvialis]|uniref:Class I SAM-dependent methyltransferase n=1 Tax=Raineyella fluvialis TaxID=2662261 RepID=A0A5Q2FES9_9ACTN|nr:hypothetical protein [Raineyella fluvialis]QGF23593.1 hypothetical protein Rai3103_07835 [Raineyella fluvialis]